MSSHQLSSSDLNESQQYRHLIVVYKLSEYKYLISDIYPGNDCYQEEIDRFLRHIRWVQLHPVLFITELRNSDTYSIEDTVIEYMSKYGIDSTRATVGPYDNPILSETQIADIQKKIDIFEKNQMPSRDTSTRQWNRHSVVKTQQSTKSYSPKKMNSALYHCYD